MIPLTRTPAPDALMEFPELAQPECSDYEMIQGERYCKRRGDCPLMFCKNLVRMGMCPKKKEG